jgi:hypothetical protein
MKITEAFSQTATVERDDRPGDVIVKFWNGWTFNESAVAREVDALRAKWRADREANPQHSARQPRSEIQADYDDAVAADEWFVR